MAKQTLLIVEDDPKIQKLLKSVLEAAGFAVVLSDNGDEVLELIERHQVDLLTLDINLGSRDGIELARQIRRVSKVPIIMVTGQGDVIDRVVGLEVGADDYITKPFHVREVVARVRSVLRRAERSAGESTATSGPSSDVEQPGGEYRFDGLTAFPDRLELLDRNGGDCKLTSGDFRLLTAFLMRPKRPLSRDQLMDLTGGVEWSPLDRTIDNQVARLRKKIERDPSKPQLNKTVRGIGYTLAAEVEVSHASGVSAKSA